MNLIGVRQIRFWIILILIIFSAMGFEEIYDDVFSDPLEGDYESQVFDKNLMSKFNNFRSPLLTQIMTDLTALGSISVLTILFIIIFSALKFFNDKKGLLYLGIVLAGTATIPLFLKLFFKRPRPENSDLLALVTTHSFPSGHAFAATAIYLGIAYYSGKYASSLLQELFFYALGGLLVATVSISRIYLGVHYPTDVLAGIFSGAMWVLLVTAFFEFKSVEEK